MAQYWLVPTLAICWWVRHRMSKRVQTAPLRSTFPHFTFKFSPLQFPPHFQPLQSHFGPVTSIAPHPHFPFILTSSTDSSIRLCRYDDPKTSSEAAKLSPTFVSSPPSLQQGKIILDFEGSRGANVPVHLVSWARTLPFSGVFLIAKRSEVFVYDCNIGALVISILLDQEGTDERMHVHGNAEPLCLFTLVEDDAGCVVAVGDSWGRVSFWNLPSWLRRDQDAQKIVSNLCN